MYRGLVNLSHKTIIANHHLHCHSSLAFNKTNITFNSRFVAFVHSTSVFMFIVASCSSRFVAFAQSHAIAMVVSDRSVDETPDAIVCCGSNNCPLRFVGGECFHCKACFQCCNHKLTRCTLCGTRTSDDCLDYMKTALLNNDDGHRSPTCEDQADPPGWRMRMVIDRMRRTGEVPMTESELEQWLKDGPSAIDGK